MPSERVCIWWWSRAFAIKRDEQPGQSTLEGRYRREMRCARGGKLYYDGIISCPHSHKTARVSYAHGQERNIGDDDDDGRDTRLRSSR